MIGERLLPVQDLDLRYLGMTMTRSRRVVGVSSGAAALGNPARVVAWLANELGATGQGLLAGQLISTGSLLVPEPVIAGDLVTATFDRLGPISQYFSE